MCFRFRKHPALFGAGCFTLTAILSSQACADTCAVEPGFDCSRAGNTVERLICTNSVLAELDNQLAGIYQTALDNFPAADQAALRSSQQSWLKKRNTCDTSTNKQQCVQLAYEARITRLQIQSGSLTVPEPVQYSCSSGEYDYLTAILYNQTALPAVVLTGNTGKDDWQYTLVLAPSGSGAKYTGEGMVFWIKGSEARFQRKESAPLQCREIPTTHQGGV